MFVSYIWGYVRKGPVILVHGVLYVTVYAEIGHLSAKFFLRYKPQWLKRKVLAHFLFSAYIV